MTTRSEKPSEIPRRQLRNLLLDRRFQAKYVGMVVFVTVAVASVLGYFAYDYSRGQTQALGVQMASQPDLHPDDAKNLRRWAAEQDRKVLYGIVFSVVLLAFVLGLVGIVITHRMAGPAYKIQRLLHEVAEGSLSVQGKLRKGDEFRQLFDAFIHMVDRLKQRRVQDAEQLDQFLAQYGQSLSLEAKESLAEFRASLLRGVSGNSSSTPPS